LDTLPSVVDLADPGFLFLRLLPRDDLLGLAKRIREGGIDEDVEMPFALDATNPFPFRSSHSGLQVALTVEIFCEVLDQIGLKEGINDAAGFLDGLHADREKRCPAGDVMPEVIQAV